ncbi:MAG: hypothetical protein ACLRXQ_07810 [Phascolarctobacterium faecium]
MLGWSGGKYFDVFVQLGAICQLFLFIKNVCRFLQGGRR